MKYAKMVNELPKNVKLRSQQEKAYNILAKGENLFLTGPGGSGKSLIVKMFMKVYQYSRNIAITSTTGTSALLIGGTTLHSYTGIGLGQGSVDAITTKIFKYAWLRKRWNELETLIIDEVSMLSPELFDKLEEIARIVRHDERPFGGIQLVLSGDFLQLPTVGSDKFCFDAKTWEKCVPNIVYLDEIIRQNDSVFQKCLNNIRIGNCPKEVIKVLNERIGVELKNDYGIKPTKLYSLNYNVDRVNNEELDELAQDGREFKEYEMETNVYRSVKNKMAVIEKFKK